MNFATVSDCMNSTYGNKYEHDMAMLTEMLHPHHTYVPWITLNGVMSQFSLSLFPGFIHLCLFDISDDRDEVNDGQSLVLP